MSLKTKTSAQPTVYLYDRYDVQIGKCELEDLTFKSGNTGVFTVLKDGTVKRKKNGTATLTVKADGLDAATCTVTIAALARTEPLRQRPSAMWSRSLRSRNMPSM